MDFGGDAVDDAVTLYDEFSDIVAVIGFGYAPAHSWVVLPFIGGIDQLIDERFRIVRHIAGDVIYRDRRDRPRQHRTNAVSCVTFFSEQSPLHLFVGNGAAFFHRLQTDRPRSFA